MLDRRAILKAGGALGGLAPGCLRNCVASTSGFLRPERVESYPLPAVKMATIEGGKVTYAVAGPADGPLVLYFHGWGDDYRVVLPLEYALADAGFRLLVPHRPGYAGTTLDWINAGKTFAWRTASDTADVARRLLDQLQGNRRRRVAVIGMSGGAPAALAFANRHPTRTAALVIQAGVTQPWTDAKYVPEILRGEYNTAFARFGWAGDRVSQAMFGLLVKLRENSFTDADRVKALAGERLAEARQDAAYQAVLARILKEDAPTEAASSTMRSTYSSPRPSIATGPRSRLRRCSFTTRRTPSSLSCTRMRPRLESATPRFAPSRSAGTSSGSAARRGSCTKQGCASSSVRSKPSANELFTLR